MHGGCWTLWVIQVGSNIMYAGETLWRSAGGGGNGLILKHQAKELGLHLQVMGRSQLPNPGSVWADTAGTFLRLCKEYLCIRRGQRLCRLTRGNLPKMESRGQNGSSQACTNQHQYISQQEDVPCISGRNETRRRKKDFLLAWKQFSQ